MDRRPSHDVGWCDPARREVIAMGDPGVGVALLTPHEGAIELHLFELAPGANSGGSYRHDGDEFW